VLRVSGAKLRGFAPGLTHQGCSGGESLQRVGDLIGSGFVTPHLSHLKQIAL